jgi:hypothetical protein
VYRTENLESMADHEVGNRDGSRFKWKAERTNTGTLIVIVKVRRTHVCNIRQAEPPRHWKADKW